MVPPPQIAGGHGLLPSSTTSRKIMVMARGGSRRGPRRPATTSGRHLNHSFVESLSGKVTPAWEQSGSCLRTWALSRGLRGVCHVALGTGVGIPGAPRAGLTPRGLRAAGAGMRWLVSAQVGAGLAGAGAWGNRAMAGAAVAVADGARADRRRGYVPGQPGCGRGCRLRWAAHPPTTTRGRRTRHTQNTTGYQFRREFSLTEGAARGTRGRLDLAAAINVGWWRAHGARTWAAAGDPGEDDGL